MTARQRGATYFLALLLMGRLVDLLDLPFERAEWEARERVVETPITESKSKGGMLSNAASEGSKAATPAAENAPGMVEDVHAGENPQAISINHATQQELQKLPGIGPALALRIVAYREEHGPLQSIQDLRRVRGIGSRTAARLAPLLRFD